MSLFRTSCCAALLALCSSSTCWADEAMPRTGSAHGGLLAQMIPPQQANPTTGPSASPPGANTVTLAPPTSLPGGVMPPPIAGGAMPNAGMPGGPMPGMPAPNVAMPGGMPGAAMPGAPMPGMPMPGMPMPGVPAAGMPVPGMPTPGVVGQALGPGTMTPPRMPTGMMPAQPSGPAGGGVPMNAGPRPAAPMGPAPDQIDNWITFAKDQIKITDKQLPQWNAFADVVRANSRKFAESRGGKGSMMIPVAATTPDRLDQMEQYLALQLELVRATKTVLPPLYAVLTDEQKKAADNFIRGPLGML